MKRLIAIILLVLICVVALAEVYSFDRYVSGEYFDTYVIDCEDINIDLQDFTSQCDLFYIEPVEGLNYPCGSQNVGNNQWKQYYHEVTVVPTSDIMVNKFNFNTRDNWQSFNFIFSLEGTTIYCEEFILENRNYGDYFKMDCDAVISSSKSIEMNYQGKTPVFMGVMSSPHIIISNGNNTSIEVGTCGFLSTDTLTLIQSSQNPVLIDGHVIASLIESPANISLQWDDAIVTVGELPAGVKIYGGDNTTVNLCKNPTQGANNIGYFTGTVMYNTDPQTGWTTTPSDEGDINLNDNSGDYWTWFHKNSAATEIGIYDDFNACMEEFISIEQFISPSTSSLVRSQKNVVKSNVSSHTSTPITPLGQKLSSGGKYHTKIIINKNITR